ncbi:unnamed protein product [Lepeophtheirus salmonis]|uniref:(salmon louse) hypothetical protein n=1 Tax=Lepeophtheirus salmonis TaxID=72036 RepID=A0A7R8CUU0_LEPSM|nr:unnamed protein product [Lepeophtheirus salmonis]CAF2903282.1 unnamed protein product [Lepeophtheirus salmonis]
MFRSRVDSVFTLTLMMLYLGVIGECPPGCVCMWKSGKESTECINQSKNSIPTGIEPSTQVLNIRGNSIKVFEDNIFLQLGITNLQKIFCSYCSVREIQPRAFRRLTNLIELDLSENVLKEIPTESWKYTKALMKLNLSGNPIKLIRAGAFKRLTFVTNLYLAHCEIETIEAEAFTSLEALLELKLENNRLNYIQGAGLFPRSLHHIEMSAEGVIAVKRLEKKFVNLFRNTCWIEPISTLKRWSKEDRAKIKVSCPSLIPAYNEHIGVYKRDCALLDEKPMPLTRFRLAVAHSLKQANKPASKVGQTSTSPHEMYLRENDMPQDPHNPNQMFYVMTVDSCNSTVTNRADATSSKGLVPMEM